MQPAPRGAARGVIGDEHALNQVHPVELRGEDRLHFVRQSVMDCVKEGDLNRRELDAASPKAEPRRAETRLHPGCVMASSSRETARVRQSVDFGTMPSKEESFNLGTRG